VRGAQVADRVSHGVKRERLDAPGVRVGDQSPSD